MFSWELLKLSQSIILRNISICVEELNYMKDCMKFKITKIACKFAIKIDQDQSIFVESIRRSQRRIYQDLTLYLSCKPKLHYRDARCKLQT